MNISSKRRPILPMHAEWMRCPRCKTKCLRPTLTSTDKHGSQMWWVCENYDVCMFPLDMPASIFNVTQTAFQKQENHIPLPKILELPQRYRYMYPLTFANSQPPSRCASVISASKANSRNETIESSETGSVSEKSSGQNRLKADNVAINTDITANSIVASTSTPSERADELDDIDEEIEAACKKRSTTYRTLPRKRTLQPSLKSWAAIIEKVASDKNASNKIINMEESELLSRMKEFFDERYFRGTPTTYKRAPRELSIAPNTIMCGSNSTRVTYRADDVETCLFKVTQDEWESARKGLKQVPRSTLVSLRAGGADELLKIVGIDLPQRKKAVGEKVGKVMREINAAKNIWAKRQKIEEKRDMQMKEKSETLQKDIHQSVSARILNRKRRRDEDDRSMASSPFSTCYSEPPTPCPSTSQQSNAEEFFEAKPVLFHIGNEGGEQDHQPEQPIHEDNWGFDFDGLYESIHTQNQVEGEQNPLDPVEALLFPAYENTAQGEFPPEQPVELAAESGDEGGNDEDEDPFAGFDNFSGLGDSNLDFVNDNFGF